MLRNQKGFTAVEGILAVILVAAIGFVGYFAYKHHTKKTSTTASTQQSSKTSSPVSTTSPAATPAPKYLVVKEAGIKFQLSSAISDAYYYDNSQDSSGKSVSFSTHSLDNLGIPACKPQVVYGSVAGGQEEGAATLGFDLGGGDQSGFKNDANAIRIGNDWYEIDAFSGCSSSNPATEAKIKAVQDAFVSAGKTITLSN